MKSYGHEGGRVFPTKEQFDKHLELPACKREGCQEITVDGTDITYPGRQWKALNYREGSHSKETEEYCFGCAFWFDRAKDMHDGVVIVEKNGERVRYSFDAGMPISKSPASCRGFGGAMWTIQFKDGREVQTNNLWCQSAIPEHFWDMFEVNARFV